MHLMYCRHIIWMGWIWNFFFGPGSSANNSCLNLETEIWPFFLLKIFIFWQEKGEILKGVNVSFANINNHSIQLNNRNWCDMNALQYTSFASRTMYFTDCSFDFHWIYLKLDVFHDQNKHTNRFRFVRLFRWWIHYLFFLSVHARWHHFFHACATTS